MNNLRPKEPLLAVILSIILPGLGQAYSGRVKRGILFFCVTVLIIVLSLLYVLTPNTKTYIGLLFLLVIFWLFGIFIIVDAYRCAKTYNIKNNLNREITNTKRVLLIIAIIFLVFLYPNKIIAQYVKSNYFQAFRIPTTSMSPTLVKGDLILVDKMIYKKSELRRGDCIVFIYPEDTKKNFVRRLIGLPGETVEIKNERVLTNGIILAASEGIPNIKYFNKGEYGKEGQVVSIPQDNYFVLGDNSAISKDSRFWGFVPRKYIIGKAYKIYYPFNRSGPIK